MIIQQGWVDCINLLLDIRLTRNLVFVVEEYTGSLHGCEFKRSQAKLFITPKAWLEPYPESSFTVVILTTSNTISCIKHLQEGRQSPLGPAGLDNRSKDPGKRLS
jgi:hypothetical protein